MARRRRRKARRATTRRAVTRRAPRRRSRRGGSRKEVFGTVLGGMAYGAVRSKISNALAPIVTNRLTGVLGTYADEAVMGTLSYLVMKKVRNPTLKKIGFAGLAIESAMAGSQLASGLSNNSLGTSSNTNGGRLQSTVF